MIFAILFVILCLLSFALLALFVWPKDVEQTAYGEENVVNQIEIQNDDNDVVSSIRIPGKGSQGEYSLDFPFAKIIVHDDEMPNQNGYFDRTVVNTANPEDIGMDDQFSVPDEWFVERDFSAQNDDFVTYMTVKPPVDISLEEIQEWATDQDFIEGLSYEVTSVIVIEGQECSVQGLHEQRVRVNIYVGEEWFYQACNNN